MKKILLFTTISLLSIAGANAQCTPDPQYTSPGIYPDSATGFASGCALAAYEQLITNVVPADTVVEIIPGTPSTVSVDSIVITSFTGLPASLSYECSTSLGGCAFPGGETGCVIITGTPTMADVGVHNLTISVAAYGGGITTPQTQDITWYSIEINDCTLGLDNNNASTVSVYPNPATDVLTIDGLSSATETITLTDLNGQVINTYSQISGSTTQLDIEFLENGIYFIQIDNSEVIRFVKK